MKSSLEARLDSGKPLPYARLPEYGWEENGFLVARDGDVISPKYGEQWVCLSGHVTVRNQTGGNWVARGTSRQTVSGQEDGEWYARGESRQTVSGHKGGHWRAYESSRQIVLYQKGGVWEAYGNSRQEVKEAGNA